jgi:beta-lactamase regulating signal transducer with metallopeptidase domain
VIAAAMMAPLGASVLLWWCGVRLGGALPPATAVRLLTVTALATALSTGFVLAVAGFEVVTLLPPVAAAGQWSLRYLRSGDPMPVLVGVVAGALVVLLLTASVRRVVNSGYALATTALVCRRLPGDAGGLVIIEDAEPDAYALVGLRGRVVVSTGMLRALNAQERRVLLAHEAAHLEHRHHMYLQLAELAAAANPLLRPVAGAVHAAVERWADESAAADVGDRHLAARALAHAGLARAAATAGRRRVGGVALSAAETHVATRVRALLAPPPRRRHGLATAVLALVVLVGSCAVHVAQDTEHRFERAHAAYVLLR